jgi:hypothetical protein
MAAAACSARWGRKGQRTFFAVIGTDGRLTRVRNVLVRETFSSVGPSLSRADVRRHLGRPGGEQAYPLKRRTGWEWKFVGEDPVTPVFYVAFDEPNRLVATGIPDPALRSGHQAGPDAAGATAPCSPLP